MPRLHLFELEDLDWFPRILRDLMTDYLCFQSSAFRLYDPVVPKLQAALAAVGERRILDLCSGGAGPVLQIQEALALDGYPVAVTMTDRFPNLRAFAAARQRAVGEVDFETRSIDATDVPVDLEGFRTVFTAIHHFRPEEARRLIERAAAGQHPVAIFDIAQRSLLMVLYTAFVVPLLVLLCAPFIRPFRWRRLLLTYIVPAVPLTCLWDGLVSQLRAYSSEELLRLGHEAASTYHWESGRLRTPLLPGGITFLIGYPRPESTRPEHG